MTSEDVSSRGLRSQSVIGRYRFIMVLIEDTEFVPEP